MTRLLPILALVSLLFGLTAPSWAQLGRGRDPVILSGAGLGSLIGASPGAIVGFRWENGAWLQVPVQVDERAVVDFGTVYGAGPSGFTFLTYTDPTTFTGPDPDPGFDADDEVVFMGRDAGERSPGAAEPLHVVPGSGLEVAVTDPLGSGTGFLYLFEGDGTLDPGSGSPEIAHDFSLLSGDYLTTYNTNNGPNPEDTRILAPGYSVHFSDRWIRDETRIRAGGAPDVDILDRHKNLFAPGICARSENTFSNGEGAIIVKKSGPVRALRGYVGANSGPTTYRIHAFYDHREDIRTVLRVHAIAGMMDYFDYSPAADSMSYFNNFNLSGATIDGVPETVPGGSLAWELVTGAQGSLAIAPIIVTDIPGFADSSYYSDFANSPITQCTGDVHEYGASGVWIPHGIPNTDPALGPPVFQLEAVRVLAYGPPDQGTGFAVEAADNARNPLAAAVAPYAATTAARGGVRPPAVRVFPNPVAPGSRILFAADAGATATVTLFDLQGRRVLDRMLEIRSSGAQSMSFPGAPLSAGVYFLQVVTGETTETTRVVVLP